MRSLLVIASVLLTCATWGPCQPGTATAQPPGPRTAPPVAPTPAAAPGPAAAPAPVAIAPDTPQRNFVAEVQANQIIGDSPELSLLLSLPRILGRPLTFAVVFLLVGLVLSTLARHVVLPRAPGDTHYAVAPDDRTRRRLAVASLVAWMVALFAASEAAGQQWFSSLLQLVVHVMDGVFGLVGHVIGGAFLVVAAAVIAYAISPRGQDIVLGAIGWFYLRHASCKPAPDEEFDLGDGVRGTVVRTDLFYTTMRTTDGQQRVVPNAWLMRSHFNWDRQAWVAPSAPTPPPPPAV